MRCSRLVNLFAEMQQVGEATLAVAAAEEARADFFLAEKAPVHHAHGADFFLAEKAPVHHAHAVIEP